MDAKKCEVNEDAWRPQQEAEKTRNLAASRSCVAAEAGPPGKEAEGNGCQDGAPVSTCATSWFFEGVPAQVAIVSVMGAFRTGKPNAQTVCFTCS